MKILFVTTFLHTTAGVGRHSYEIWRHTKKRDYKQVDIVTDIGGGKELGGIEIFKKHNSMMHFIQNCFAARRKARSYDIVHALEVWPHGIYAWFSVLGTNKKLFLMGVGTYSVAALYKPIKGMLMKAAYKRATNTFCISEYTRDRIRDVIPLDSIITVYMGLNHMQEPSPEKVQAVQEKYGSIDRHPIFITVGEIKDRKGQLDSLTGMHTIREKYPNFLYLIVGKSLDQEYRKQIEQYASDYGLEKNIRLITNCPDDTVLAALYSISTIFLLNSNTDLENHHFEGFGQVFLEAGQFGVPSVGSSDSGIESAIKDGETGFLTPQKDHAAIGKALDDILSGDYDHFSNNTRAFAKTFDWNTTVSEYAHYY